MTSWTLAKEYGFRDIDGRQPDWWSYVETSINEILDRGGPSDADERRWIRLWYMQLKREPRWKQLSDRISLERYAYFRF